MTDETYTLEKITDRLRREAARADGFDRIVKFDFGSDGVVVVDARQSPPAVSNDDAPADTTLSLSLADFTALARGRIDPMRAVFTRKLKVAGDMGAAMKLAQLFKGRDEA